MKKRGVDSRQEPAEDGVPPETNYRVDRVFAPPRRADTASQAASALLEQRRSSSQTTPPAVAAESAESELSLRRQLSRLQRQLSEAQVELANKDDELAAEIEKRLQTVAAHDALIEQQRELQERVDQLAAYESRTQGMEQRVADANANAEEMAQFLEREREARMSAQSKIDELTRSFDETRQLWNAERQMLEERMAQDHAQLEAQRTSSLQAAEQAHAAAIARITDGHAAELSRVTSGHEAELAQLKEAHERSVQALRGELEPRALEARTLAEEREQLDAKIKALEADAVREAAAREEAHARAMAEAAEAHVRDKAQAAGAYSIEQAAATRAHASELAKAIGERDAQILSLQQSVRSVEGLAKGLEEGTALLREQHQKTLRELAETKEKAAQLDASVKSLEERLLAANGTAEVLVEEKRVLREQLEASASESRRNSLDRLRFVAYLEEGLALLGALPPTFPEPPTIETIEGTDAIDE